MSLDSITYIKVFPGIGTARVGNSPEYFIGPEFPGDIPNAGKNYKDKNNFLKPQAARFRVYGYDANDNVVAEITHDPANGTTLEWDVHMRNLKAANYAFQGKFGFNPDQYRNPGVSPAGPGTDPNSRDSLIIDAKPQTISGNNLGLAQGNAVLLDQGMIFSGIGTAKIPASLVETGKSGDIEVTYKEKKVSLGRLETDDAGRLIVVGGKGEAGCLIEPPIILQKGVATFNDTNVQLGVAQPTTAAAGTKPNAFYSNETIVDLKNLEYVSLKLASNEGGNESVTVYDVINLYVNNNTDPVYTFDFRNADHQVTPHTPLDVTDALKKYLGTSVTIKIECVTETSADQGASDIWLTYINENPTSNGNSYFNNPGWYDDTAGGSINASVTINGKKFMTNNDVDKRGWVAVSPPKYVPSMNNVVSLLDLQLAMFPEEDPVSGTVNFAYIDSDGHPNFASGAPTNFDKLSSLTKGEFNSTIVRYNGNDYMAYTDSSGAFLLAESTDGGASWESKTICPKDANGNDFTKTTDHAPALCVYNGALTYVVLIKGGGFDPNAEFVYVGTSIDTVNFEFVFEEAASGQGVEAASGLSGLSAAAYNGQLYVAFLGTNNDIIIAHKYLNPSTRQHYYTYNSLEIDVLDNTIPKLAVFFGKLYCAYTGTDSNAYIGDYSNYSPTPAEPAKVSFDFNQVSGAPTSTMSPSIGSSHGKLYYAIVDESSNLQLAIASPGLFEVTFENQGPIDIISQGSLSIANFSDIEFFRDIYPTLRTVTDYAWVNEPAFQGHSPGKPGDFLRGGESLPFYSNPDGANNVWRSAVYNFIRQAEQLTPDVPPPPFGFDPKTAIPDGGVQSGTLMPHLFGEGGSPLENGFNGTNFPNQWLSLTPHQLWKFQQWVNGNFTAGTEPTFPPEKKTFDMIPLAEQPAALNFSALEPTVGGGFHPGIELTYYMKEPAFFAEGFRFNDSISYKDNTPAPITPGSVAGYMSIPWQGDFWSCNISWWAAMRPDIVIPKDTPPSFIPWFRGEGVGIPVNADNIDGYEGGYEHMVRYWSDFGFVVPTGEMKLGMFVMAESERNACLDNVQSPCPAYNPAEPVHLGLAQVATSSSGNFPDTFYTRTLDVIIPASGDIILSSNEMGTGDIYVDDQCVITMKYTTEETVVVDGIKTTKITGSKTVTIYSNDFSNGNSGHITPLPPQSLADAITSTGQRGRKVSLTIEYIDLHPGSKGASDFWLVYPVQPVQLGASQPLAQPQGNLPAPFYINTIPVNIPAQGKIILSGSADGTASFKVDNECIISVNGKQVYSNKFGSTTAIPPTASAPVDITSDLQDYAGTTVFIEIQYINFNAVSQATEIWLTFES